MLQFLRKTIVTQNLRQSEIDYNTEHKYDTTLPSFISSFLKIMRDVNIKQRLLP